MGTCAAVLSHRGACRSFSGQFRCNWLVNAVLYPGVGFSTGVIYYVVDLLSRNINDICSQIVMFESAYASFA